MSTDFRNSFAIRGLEKFAIKWLGGSVLCQHWANVLFQF